MTFFCEQSGSNPKRRRFTPSHQMAKRPREAKEIWHAAMPKANLGGDMETTKRRGELWGVFFTHFFVGGKHVLYTLLGTIIKSRIPP